MKKLIGALFVCALPLSAQSWELGVFVGQQSYNTFTVTGVEAKPESKVMGTLRLGYSMVDIGPALLQINGTYQPKATSTIKFNGLDIGVKLDDQASSVGLAFIFKAGVSASVGVDYRWDKLTGNFEGASSSATYGRPWVRANIGFAFPTPVLKPFLGVEVAAAIGKKDVDATVGPATDEEALKGLAPKLQIGIYGGIRF